MNYINFFKFLKDKEGKKIPDYINTMYYASQNPDYRLTQDQIDGFIDEKGNMRPPNMVLLKVFPDNAKIKGNLDVAEAQGTPIELPDNLTVEGNLEGWDSKISFLPNNLTVLGNVIISYTPTLRFLGKNIKVGGELLLHNTELESLPKDLKVGTRLTIANTPFLKTLRNKYPTLSDDEIRQKLKSVFPGVNYIQLGQSNNGIVPY